jgi:hypothetical protein
MADSPVFADSRAIRFWAAACSGSVLVGALRRVAVGGLSIWDALGRVPPLTPSASGVRSLDDLRPLASGWLLGLPFRLTDVLDRASGNSASAAWCRRLVAEFAALDPSLIARLLGLVLATALVTHLLVFAATPPNLRHAMPDHVGGAIALIAFVLLVAPRHVGRAWHDWRGRR